MAAALQSFKEAAVSAIPKLTTTGDSHSYAGFARVPPASRGTVHFTSLAFLTEPAMGASREKVRIECGFLRTGGMPKSIQVTAAPENQFSKGPSLCGWLADGAVINGTRLMGRSVLGVAITAAAQRVEVPAAMASWFTAFSQVAVTNTQHGSKKAQVISAWKDTVVQHKLNERLTPIMQASSLIGQSISVDEIVATFDKQMQIVDPSLRPQGKTKLRLKNFLDASLFGTVILMAIIHRRGYLHSVLTRLPPSPSTNTHHHFLPIVDW